MQTICEALQIDTDVPIMLRTTTLPQYEGRNVAVTTQSWAEDIPLVSELIVQSPGSAFTNAQNYITSLSVGPNATVPQALAGFNSNQYEPKGPNDFGHFREVPELREGLPKYDFLGTGGTALLNLSFPEPELQGSDEGPPTPEPVLFQTSVSARLHDVFQQLYIKYGFLNEGQIVGEKYVFTYPNGRVVRSDDTFRSGRGGLVNGATLNVRRAPVFTLEGPLVILTHKDNKKSVPRSALEVSFKVKSSQLATSSSY